MIQSVYNYLMPGIMPKPVSASNNTHKKSELRSLYNHIVNMNKRSPLYKVTLSNDSQLFAISLKEASMGLNESLSTLSKTEDSPFNKVRVTSNQPEKVAANIISEDTSNLPERFTVQLEELAKPQVNKSRIISKDSGRPRPGSYSFIIEVEEDSYEFQFNIKSDSTNEEILNKLAKFMNRSNIGLKAFVEETDKNHVVFSIASKATGDIGEPLFSLEDTNAPDYQSGLVEFYGLDHTVQDSSNAQFTLSGEHNQALTNHLVLNHSLQLDFYEATSEAAEISYLPDADKILPHIEHFANSYNEVIQLAKDYPSVQGLSAKLIREMKLSIRPYKNEMESCGLYFDENNMLQIDDSLARQAIEEGDMQTLFSAEYGMTKSLARKSASVTVNPMDYVDKKLIIYPNYSKEGVTQAYSPTMYSGMLFNYYC